MRSAEARRLVMLYRTSPTGRMCDEDRGTRPCWLLVVGVSAVVAISVHLNLRQQAHILIQWRTTDVKEPDNE